MSFLLIIVDSRNVVNVASASAGTICEASSVIWTNHDCTKAIDEMYEHGVETSWASAYETVGAWINITFPEAHTVLGIRVYGRCTDPRNVNSAICLTFSDETEQNVS